MKTQETGFRVQEKGVCPPERGHPARSARHEGVPAPNSLGSPGRFALPKSCPVSSFLPEPRTLNPLSYE